MKHKFTQTLAFLLFLAATVSAQPCQYLAYDGFDYTSGLPLHGLSGGSGWANPWEVQVANQSIPGYQTVPGGSLSWPDLQATGTALGGGKVYLTAGRLLNTDPDGVFADYVGDNGDFIGDEKGRVLWMSALIRKNKDNNSSVFTGLHDSNIPWCDNCTNGKVEIGYFGANSEVNGEKRWTLRVGNQYFPSSVPLSTGQTAFLVLRIEFNNDNTAFDFFVNPAQLGNSQPVPALTATTGAMHFRSVVAYLGNDPDNGGLDELRIARTYACAAPDASVAVDLAPVAIMNVSGDDGIAPFTVQLDGLSSYDTDGGPLSFVWNPGDGSPAVSGTTINHTYHTTGELTVKMTVRDSGGLESVAVKRITVRESDGSFPCQTSFTLLRQASCDGTGGILRINNPASSFSLQNSSGQLISPDQNIYNNLSAGNYLYTAQGNNGCRDAFPLVIPVDSTTCNGWEQDICHMLIGTNLSGLADWSPERPLRNLMKHVRPEPVVYNDACWCWDNGNLAGIQTDTNGYPLHIPQLYNGVENKVRYVISAGGGNLQAGKTYVLLFDGSGSLNVAGSVNTISSTPGRLLFSVQSDGNIWVNIEHSDAGNYVRNFRLLRQEDENADIDSEPFYAGFLEKIAPFRVLRFMDLGATNSNPLVNWADRTRTSRLTYAVSGGIPYEVMIQLANQSHKSVWLCVPHQADSNYVAQMARLFRDQLDPELVVYLEYSNEVWNWIFAQAHYNVQTAPSNLNYGRAMAEKAARTFRIWHDVFGDQKSRIRRVLGLQAGYNYLNEQILSQLHPSEWDLASPASYIGLDHGSTGNPVLNAASTPQDLVENARNNWIKNIPALRQDYSNIRLFGKGIVNYEGGQHFVGDVFGSTYPYQQAMYDAQYTQEIYNLYRDMLDTVRNWGGRMFGNFILSGRQESIYGSWGVLNDIDIEPPYLQSAPKYQALLDQLCPMTPDNTFEPQAEPEALKIRPNPSAGAISVFLESERSLETRLYITDMTGRPIFHVPVCVSAGENIIPVSPGNIPAGIYQIRIPGIGMAKMVRSE